MSDTTKTPFESYVDKENVDVGMTAATAFDAVPAAEKATVATDTSATALNAAPPVTPKKGKRKSTVADGTPGSTAKKARGKKGAPIVDTGDVTVTNGLPLLGLDKDISAGTDQTGTPVNTPTKRARAKKAVVSTEASSGEVGNDGLPPLSVHDALMFKLKDEGMPWDQIATALIAAGAKGIITKGSIAKKYSRLSVARLTCTDDDVDAMMQAYTEIQAGIRELVKEHQLEIKRIEDKKWADVKKAFDQVRPGSKLTQAQITKKCGEVEATWVPTAQRADDKGADMNGDGAGDGETGSAEDGAEDLAVEAAEA